MSVVIVVDVVTGSIFGPVQGTEVLGVGEGVGRKGRSTD